MGWFGFLLLLVVIAGGIYFYQKLLVIEQEIRREHADLHVRVDDPADDVVKPEVAPPIFREQVRLEPDPPAEQDVKEPVSLEDALLKVISDLPGLLQTELYALFPGEERKRLQTILLRLDRNGVIKREKKKSSYRVFLA